MDDTVAHTDIRLADYRAVECISTVITLEPCNLVIEHDDRVVLKLTVSRVKVVRNMRLDKCAEDVVAVAVSVFIGSNLGND